MNDSALRGGVTRRRVLAGSLGAGIAAAFGIPALRQGAAAAAGRQLLGFRAVPPSAADRVTAPEGYRVQVVIPWGTPITGEMPALSRAGSAAEQAQQTGMHHDGMHFFPIEGADPREGRSTDGLLVVNHEYIEPRFLHASHEGRNLDSGGVVADGGVRDADEVRKELAAHGVSVARIRRDRSGAWSVVRDRRNRRITGMTEVELAGPVRGTKHVVTRYSPVGTRTRGTLNNCSSGATPWNTYLAAEENWHLYFTNDAERVPREQRRYGIAGRPSRYRWELADGAPDDLVRFDVSAKGATPADDDRNEPNCFGWMVEIDPFDPDARPKKRTHLGRFAHEGVVFAPAVPGRPVVGYSGDDARFEYVYKFVSARPYDPATADGSLLDEGTLYAARFDDDGRGEWLALAPGENGLTPDNGFADLADILVNTRLAADRAGATKMDRPEWGAVDPHTGDVYFTLTNNTKRKPDQVNAANPRANNQLGHIIRWREAGFDHAATSFSWDIFALAGDAESGRVFDGRALGEDDLFACPDGLYFDGDRRLWILTDVGNDEQHKGPHAPMKNNQMLCADPVTGEIRRFLTGPVGQEITGITMTPDQRTLFVNVQHPGATTTPEAFAAGRYASRWPDGDGVPRSATLIITRDDGGVIGAP